MLRNIPEPGARQEGPPSPVAQYDALLRLFRGSSGAAGGFPGSIVGDGCVRRGPPLIYRSGKRFVGQKHRRGTRMELPPPPPPASAPDGLARYC